MTRYGRHEEFEDTADRAVLSKMRRGGEELVLLTRQDWAQLISVAMDYVRWTDAVSDALGMSEPAGEGNPRMWAGEDEVVDVIEDLKSVYNEHRECPVWCDECLRWERPQTCEHCEGSGYGGPLRIPADAEVPGWIECEWCAGDGRKHDEEEQNEPRRLRRVRKLMASAQGLGQPHVALTDLVDAMTGEHDDE